MGLLALFTNCIPLFGGAAVFYTTVLLILERAGGEVCLGIAVDDTIHVLQFSAVSKEERRL